MSVVIRSATGHVKTIGKKSAVSAFCEALAKMDESELGLRTDIWVAYHLGLGSKEQRAVLDRGDYPAWSPHWFTRPDIGDKLLPTDALWEIHKYKDHAKAALTITSAGYHGEATAKCPWAAFAICLIRAKEAGAF